jgi:hypothetical protein
MMIYAMRFCFLSPRSSLVVPVMKIGRNNLQHGRETRFIFGCGKWLLQWFLVDQFFGVDFELILMTFWVVLIIIDNNGHLKFEILLTSFCAISASNSN